MITALLELTSCATLEKRIVPAYQHACEQGESAACDDATQRVAKYVEEADKVAVEQQQKWKQQSEAFIAALQSELDAAACLHRNIKFKDGNRNPYVPPGISCPDIVTFVNATDDRTKSTLVGVESGLKITCVGNRYAPDCTYNTKDLPSFSGLTDLVSNDYFCSTVDTVVLNFSHFDIISERTYTIGKLEKTEIQLWNDPQDQYPRFTLLCYSLSDDEVFCEAQRKEDIVFAPKQKQYTHSLACPSIIGLLSDDWIPHQKVITALSENEIQEMRNVVRENKEYQQQQAAQSTVPVVVQEEQPGYFLTTTVLGFADVAKEYSYRKKPTFPGVEGLESVLKPFAPENLFYEASFDAAQGSLRTDVTLVGYTEQQADLIREQLNILVIIFMSELTESGKSNIQITLGEEQLKQFPVSARFAVTYLPSADNVKLYSTTQQHVYREICSEDFFSSNASLIAFHQELPGYRLECVIEENKSPALWGIASFAWNQWGHQPFVLETIATGAYTAFTKDDYTLKHVACNSGATWTAYENGTEIVQTFSSLALGQEFGEEVLNQRTGEKFCKQKQRNE